MDDSIVITFQDEDTPDIEYVYADSDTLAGEIAEFYSYTENPEFPVIQKSFDECMVKFGLPSSWKSMEKTQRVTAIQLLLDMTELTSRTERLSAARAILYIAQVKQTGIWPNIIWSSRVISWSTRPTHTVAVGIDHYFHTFVRPHFPNLAKQNNIQVRIVIATGGTVGPAEGIIDDTNVLFLLFLDLPKMNFIEMNSDPNRPNRCDSDPNWLVLLHKIG